MEMGKGEADESGVSLKTDGTGRCERAHAHSLRDEGVSEGIAAPLDHDRWER